MKIHSQVMMMREGMCMYMCFSFPCVCRRM